MGNRGCYASVSKIADYVGVSYNTALRRLKLLVDQGYLIDETPGRRNVPHVYRLTGKLDVEHVSETRVVESPSSPRERDEPSSPSVGDPSSPSVGDEDTKEKTRHNTENAAAAFSENQQHALDALREIGFVPDSDAVRFARDVPEKTLGWTGYARREGLGGGFVRQRLAAGDDPPVVKEHLPQSNGEVFR